MQTSPAGVSKAPQSIALCSTAVFAALGIWIFYNTKVVNRINSEEDNEKIASEYEKLYKKYHPCRSRELLR